MREEPADEVEAEERDSERAREKKRQPNSRNKKKVISTHQRRRDHEPSSAEPPGRESDTVRIMLRGQADRRGPVEFSSRVEGEGVRMSATKKKEEKKTATRGGASTEETERATVLSLPGASVALLLICSRWKVASQNDTRHEAVRERDQVAAWSGSSARKEGHCPPFVATDDDGLASALVARPPLFFSLPNYPYLERRLFLEPLIEARARAIA